MAKVNRQDKASLNVRQLLRTGALVLILLGVGIFLLAGLAWQSPTNVGEAAERAFRLISAVGLLLWLIGVFLFMFLMLWWQRLQEFVNHVEERWFTDAMQRLEERLTQVTLAHISQLAESLASMRESVDQLQRAESPHIRLQETLYHAFLLLSEAEDEERLCENIVTAFATLAACEQVMLFLGENELGPLTLMAALGLPTEVVQEWRGREWRPPLWGVVAPALAKRRAYGFHVRGAVEGHQPHEFPWEIRGDRLLALPLLGIQSIQGVVVLVQEDARVIQNQPYIRMLEMVAQFAGRTLENLRLARAAQEHMAELVTIQSITRSLALVRSLEEMLTLLSAEIAQIAGPAYVGLILAEDIPVKRVRTSFPPDAPEYPCLMEQIDWRVIRWVFNAAQPVFYTPGQVGDDVGNVMFEVSGQVMAVPVEGRDEMLGVLVVASRDERMFEEPHLVGVRTVAGAVAVGLLAVRHMAYTK